MKTIWNTVLRANFRCGRMHRTRAVPSGRGVFGTAVGPNVTPGCCCESLPGTVAKAVPGISFVFPQRRPRRGCAKKKQ